MDPSIQRRRESRLRRKLVSAFREREVLIRSNDRVRAVTLRPVTQVVCASVIALAVGWSAFATTGLLYENRRVQTQEREVVLAQAEYMRLLGEVARYHHAQQSIVEALESSHEALVASLVEQEAEDANQDALAAIERRLEISRAEAVLARSALQDRADSFEEDLEKLLRAEPEIAGIGEDVRRTLARDEDERGAVVAARDTLRENLDETRRRLSASEDEARSLRARLAERDAELREVRENLAAVRQSRDNLEQRREALVAWLNDARRSAGDWRGEARSLDERLLASERERVRLDEARLRLGERVRRLAVALEEAQDHGNALEARIAALGHDLTDSRRENANLQRERSTLVRQVEGLQTHLASLQTAQHGLVERLSAKALEGIEALEARVENTGLDIEALLDEVRRRDGSEAAGGPLLPMIGDDLLDPTVLDAHTRDAARALEESVLRLDDQVNRLGALQMALTSLPLAEPLEEYWISSTFGRRQDPITGGAARHEGLDFAAPMGSPVHATGPGEVVYADWLGAYGRLVEIDHGMGIHSRYAHLQSISVAVGDSVAQGEKIGQLGTSGRSTGPHVHYEILVNGTPYDPMKFVKAGEDVLKD